MATNIGDVFVGLGLNNKEFKQRLKDSQKDLDRFARSTKAIGKGLTVGVTVPLAGLGLAAIKVASDFESSFAGVRKTVEETATTSFAVLEQGFRDMAKEIPISVNELNRVGEAAGQLGVEADDILSFTRTVAQLGVTTNLSAEEAATSLARFANITGGLDDTNVAALADTLVTLGNNFATTESEILSLGVRLASASDTVGFAQENILALAAVMKNVGVEAEAGGTNLSKTFLQIEKAVALGSQELEDFARISGQTVDEFTQKFATDGQGAVLDFIKGLGDIQDAGGSVTVALDQLGIKGARQIDVLSRLAKTSGQLDKGLTLANEAVTVGGQLADEASKRYETFESQLQLVVNQGKDVLITLGKPLLDILKDLLEASKPLIDELAEMAQQFADLDPNTQLAIVGILGLVAALGPALIVVGQLSVALNTLIGVWPLVIAGVAKLGGAFVATSASTASYAAVMTGTAVPATAAATTALGALAAVLGTVAAGLAIGAVIGTAVRELTHLGEVLDDVTLKFFNLSETPGLGDVGISEQDLALIETAEQTLDRVFTRTAAGVAEAQKEMNAWREELIETSGAVADVETPIDDLGGGVEDLTGNVTKLTEELEKSAEQLESERQFAEQAARMMELLRSNSTALVSEQMRLEAQVALTNAEIAEQAGVAFLAQQEHDRLMETTRELAIAQGLISESTESAVQKIRLADSSAFNLGDTMDGVNDILSEARGLMTLFGVDAESTFGKLIQGASEVFDAFNSILGILDKVTSVFGEGGGLSSLFSGGLGGGGGGGLGGLFGGGGFADFFKSAGGIGLIATGGVLLGKFLASLFGDKADIEETVQRDLGVPISEALQEVLNQLGEDRGLSTAMTLSLSKIFDDALASGNAIDPDLFSERLADAFSFFERGEITENELVTILEEGIQRLLPQLDELGETGVAQLERLIRASQTFGVEFDGLDMAIEALAQTLLEEAVAGGDAFLDAMNAAGDTGREQLEFIKNLAEELGLEFEGLDEIIRILAGSFDSAADSARNIPTDFPGPGGGGDAGLGGLNIPGFASGGSFTAGAFSNTLFAAGDGPRAEDVNISPVGSQFVGSAAGGGGGRGMTVSNSFTFDMRDAIVADDPDILAGKISDAVTTVVRDNLGGAMTEIDVRVTR